jgi:HPt (histidine-containing phosphotransfer) domain-containing protein
MTDSDAAKYRLVDWSSLVAKFGGDAAIASTLLGIAQRSSAAMPAELRAAAAAADCDSLARLAHKLKGTTGDICAHVVREQATATELAARAASPTAVNRANDLADALDALLLELQSVATAT